MLVPAALGLGGRSPRESTVSRLPLCCRPAVAGVDALAEPCEHVFVSSKGSLRGNFQRAIDRRQLVYAEALARQLEPLSVSDALAFLLLLAEHEPRRFDRAGARWHARFALEASGIGLLESQVALSAVMRLPAGDRKAASVLRELARRYRVPNVEATLRRFG